MPGYESVPYADEWRAALAESGGRRPLAFDLAGARLHA
jgi:hypothetical protein